MIRRFIYDSRLGAVVELGQHVHLVTDPGDVYDGAKQQHRISQDESAGTQLRNAALERADRRVFAHKRYGDERRWRE